MQRKLWVILFTLPIAEGVCVCRREDFSISYFINQYSFLLVLSEIISSRKIGPGLMAVSTAAPSSAAATYWEHPPYSGPGLLGFISVFQF